MDKDEFHSMLDTREAEIETLEKSILALTAQLRERDAEIERLQKQIAELSGNP